jgi:DNA mismatch repair protein MutH
MCSTPLTEVAPMQYCDNHVQHATDRSCSTTVLWQPFAARHCQKLLHCSIVTTMCSTPLTSCSTTVLWQPCAARHCQTLLHCSIVTTMCSTPLTEVPPLQYWQPCSARQWQVAHCSIVTTMCSTPLTEAAPLQYCDNHVQHATDRSCSTAVLWQPCSARHWQKLLHCSIVTTMCRTPLTEVAPLQYCDNHVQHATDKLLTAVLWQPCAARHCQPTTLHCGYKCVVLTRAVTRMLTAVNMAVNFEPYLDTNSHTNKQRHLRTRKTVIQSTSKMS